MDTATVYRDPVWTPDMLRVKLARLLREQGGRGRPVEYADGYYLALDFLGGHDLLPEFVAYVEEQG